MGKWPCGIHIRDIEERLFRYLYEYKIATSAQIGRDIYPGISHQAIYKRLNLLIRMGYLQANYHRELGGRLAYSLGRLAFTEFIQSGDWSGRKQYQSASPIHDIDLVDIGQRLRGLRQAVGYLTENELDAIGRRDAQDEEQSLSTLKPDAVLKLRFPKGDISLPIEYERSLKYGSRYLAFFKKYYARSQISGVLLVGRDGETNRRLQGIEQKILMPQQEPKIFYSILDEVTRFHGAISFSNLKNEKLTLC